MTDNTDELQELIDKANGDTVTIPLGYWNIDATRGLQLRSGLKLDIQGVLQALPNDQPHSNVLAGNNIENVQINLASFALIMGDRNKHLNSIGEWGMGVLFSNCSGVVLSGGGTITNCWGDGIYVIGCENVTVDSVNSLGNRRQGMSVISVDGLTVRGSAFNNTSGTAPSSGIDLEPDFPTEFIKNVDIGHCQFVNNAGAGVLFGFGGAPMANFININVHDNLYKGNKPIGGLNTWYANLMYAVLRHAPGYDWWGFPTNVRW